MFFGQLYLFLAKIGLWQASRRRKYNVTIIAWAGQLTASIGRSREPNAAQCPGLLRAQMSNAEGSSSPIMRVSDPHMKWDTGHRAHFCSAATGILGLIAIASLLGTTVAVSQHAIRATA